MKRPDEHITETKSQRIFEKIVPVEWVCREVKPDYGVDYLVEIFKNNESTGKTFFVQLKGSTQKIENDVFKKKFSIENLKYYKSLAIPVIIICVSVNTEQIWGIWANKLIEQKSLKDEQQTLSLSLDTKYLLNESSFYSVASQTELSDRLGIFVEAETSLTESFNSHILRWVENYYSNSVSVKFNNLPKHLRLAYLAKNDYIQLTIETSHYANTLDIIGLNEELPFLHRPRFDNTEINDFNKEILFSIAIALARQDIRGSLRLLHDLIYEIDFSSQDKWSKFDPLGLLILAKESHVIPLFNDLIQGLIKQDFFEMFLFCDLAYFIIGTEELQEYRIENLTSVVEKSMDEQTQGTCYYNIGNILKPKTHEAIWHYFKAARLFPDYKNRSYWWREMAGLLFSKKHYSWAEECYKKSLKFSSEEKGKKIYFRLEKVTPSEQNLIQALLADCLFMQGKFSESNQMFEKYFKNTSNISQEWILKNMVCLELMNGDLDNASFDRDKSMVYCERSLSISDKKEAIELLNKALKSWPTNGLAWFNLGVALDKEQKYNEALFAFLITGLIQDGDKEAQFNALIICFNKQKFDFLQSILIYISEKHGETVINDLSDYLMKKNLPLEQKKGLIKAFQEMIEIIKANSKQMI